MRAIIGSENDDVMLDAKEAGKIFGVGASAMYKRAKRQQIPHHHMGRKIYFLKSEMFETIRNS